MQHELWTAFVRPLRASLLSISSATLLTLAFEPFGQWYLAWLALVPWMIVAIRSRTIVRAAAFGFFGGTLFYTLNVWWLWTASIPGLVVLIAYWSLYWGVAAGAIRSLGLDSPGRPFGIVVGVLLIALIWVACEWLRCNLIEGFPWLPLGVSQTPCVAMCQVADLGGPWIVSFWVALINAIIAATWLRRDELQSMAPAARCVGGVLLVVLAYGVFRLATTHMSPGPRVMMVQSNFAHVRGGAPTATPQEVVKFFLTELESQLKDHRVDLIVMPEAAFPPINQEARTELARAPVGPFLDETSAKLASIAKQSGASLLAGGNAVTGWIADGTARAGSEIRNAAYYFPGSEAGGVERYDKIHLVPFSELAPFASGPKWLQHLGLAIAARRAAQPLTAGSLETTAPFSLTWGDTRDGEPRRLRFITPICLEAVDPSAVRRLMRAAGDSQPPELIANLSNDGWFATQEKHQHFQTLAFRAIEHRVPLVRSSNTGVSGWIDSTGRVRETARVNESGIVIAAVELDSRSTLYARFGDLFAGIMIAIAAAGVALHHFGLSVLKATGLAG